jgi:predicted PurR-regulated permease PerM
MAQKEASFEPRVSRLFAPAPWLRDLGTTAWFLVGVALLVVGIVWLLALTNTIVMPVITASIVAAVLSPVVRWLDERGLSRALATVVVFLAIVVISGLVIFAILSGVTSQLSEIKGELASAKSHIATWLKDMGVDAQKAQDAVKQASSTSTDGISTLLNGVASALKTISSLAVFLSFTALSLFFLLKDATLIRNWTESHMRMPRDVAHQVFGRALQSLRGYFVGVTIVAAFNAVVVTLGAFILGIPEKGAIALVTFLGAYIPYLGAWTAGAFSVLVALGGAGTDAAVGMIVVQLLANGILQQLIQPVAYGAALGIHPLAVLIVTIAGGALFGTVGLILAAPVTAAFTRIARDFAAERAETSGAEPAAT